MKDTIFSFVLLAPALLCQLRVLNTQGAVETYVVTLIAALICGKYNLVMFANGFEWGGAIIAAIQLIVPVTKALTSGVYLIDALSFSMIIMCMISYFATSCLVSSFTMKNERVKSVLRYVSVFVLFHLTSILGVQFASIFVHDESLTLIMPVIMTISYLVCDRYLRADITPNKNIVAGLAIVFIIELFVVPIISSALLLEGYSFIRIAGYDVLGFFICILIAALAKSSLGYGIFTVPHPKNIIGLSFSSLFVPPQPHGVIINDKSSVRISTSYNVFMYLLPILLFCTVYIPLVASLKPKYLRLLPIFPLEYFRFLIDQYYDTCNNVSASEAGDSLESQSVIKRKLRNIRITGDILKCVIFVMEVAKFVFLAMVPLKWGFIPFLVLRSLSFYVRDVKEGSAKDFKSCKHELTAALAVFRGMRVNQLVLFGIVQAHILSNSILNQLGTDVITTDIIQRNKSVEDNMSLIIRVSIAVWLGLLELGRYAHPQELVKTTNKATHCATLINPNLVTKLAVVSYNPKYYQFVSVLYSLFMYVTLVILPNNDQKYQYALSSLVLLFFHYQIINAKPQQAEDREASIPSPGEEIKSSSEQFNIHTYAEQLTASDAMTHQANDAPQPAEKYMEIINDKENAQKIANSYPVPFPFLDNDISYIVLFCIINSNFIIPMRSFRFILLTGFVVFEGIKHSYNIYQKAINSDEEQEKNPTILAIKENLKKVSAVEFLVFCGVMSLLVFLYMLFSRIGDFVIRFELVSFQFLSSNYNINLKYLQHIGSGRMVKGTNMVFKSYYYISRVTLALGSALVFFRYAYSFCLKRIPNAKLVNTELKHSEETNARIRRFIRNPLHHVQLLPYSLLFLNYATACMLLTIDPSKRNMTGKTEAIVQLIMTIITAALINPPLFILLPVHTLLISALKNIFQLLITIFVCVSVLACTSVYWLDIMMIVLVLVDAMCAVMIDFSDAKSNGEITAIASLPFAVALLWCVIITIVYGYIARERKAQEQILGLINTTGDTVAGSGKQGLVSTLISEEGRQNLRKMMVYNQNEKQDAEPSSDIVGETGDTDIEFMLKQTIKTIMSNPFVAKLYNKCVNERDDTLTRKVLDNIENKLGHSRTSMDGSAGIGAAGDDLFGDVEMDTRTINMTRVITTISISITIICVWLNVTPLASIAFGALYGTVSGGIKGIGTQRSVILGSLVMLLSRVGAELFFSLFMDHIDFTLLLKDLVLLVVLAPSIAYDIVQIMGKNEQVGIFLTTKLHMNSKALRIAKYVLVSIMSVVCVPPILFGAYQGIHLLAILCIIMNIYYGFVEEIGEDISIETKPQASVPTQDPQSMPQLQLEEVPNIVSPNNLVANEPTPIDPISIPMTTIDPLQGEDIPTAETELLDAYGGFDFGQPKMKTD